MLAYYPLEHIYFLASQKIISVNNRRLNKIAIWSCRFWAAYVILQLLHLREDQHLLRLRQKSLKGVESTGEQKEEISRRRWALWNEALVNLGYLPLTIHWYVCTGSPRPTKELILARSLEQGLYRNEVRSAFLITIPN